jgi:transketolase
MELDNKLAESAINTVRFLSLDAIQKADSGHPGLPMGTAVIAYTLWMRHLRHNPKNPNWPNRDRFILSGGHGSMLLYSLLHLTGYEVSLDDIKSFRQLGSCTPGHPELGITPGVEITTGPLGQGFANGVGMAIAEAHLANVFNRNIHNIIDHFTYAIVTDGDLMEGVSSEAASYAGHLQLGKLIYLYDDNQITIDGATDITFSEDRKARFLSYGWHVLEVNDGNDIEEIDNALTKAKNDNRPSLIICRTHIGYGLPTKQDTPKAHGEAPGRDEVISAKQNFGWPLEPDFFIPPDVLNHFRTSISKGRNLEKNWQQNFEEYAVAYPNLAQEFSRRTQAILPIGWEKQIPLFPQDNDGMATREASGKVLNAIADALPELVGGSADLTASNKTWIQISSAFQKNQRSGRNFYFGVREHAMGAIINGITAHKGIIPFSATYLVFSDYLRPALRISAISKIPSIWIFTHDSIAVGEDGPTHQPVEHLAGLRAIPNLTVIRPGDANEVSQAWEIAIKNRKGPTAIILCRQPIPILSNTSNEKYGVRKGAYIFTDFGLGKPELILIASGSELSLIIEAGQILANDGINVRIVSFPSWDRFLEQDDEYIESVLPSDSKLRLAIEPGVSQGWEKWLGPEGTFIGLNSFGASAPPDELLHKFGITVENIISQSKNMLAKS